MVVLADMGYWLLMTWDACLTCGVLKYRFNSSPVIYPHLLWVVPVKIEIL